MSVMMLAQIETATKLADAAAQKSDRWLFLFTLVLLVAAGVWIVRLLLNDRSEVIGQLRQSQVSHESKLEQIIRTEQDIMSQFVARLEQNTLRLEANTRALELNSRLLEGKRNA